MNHWLIDYKQMQGQIEFLESKLDREKRELKRWTYGDLQNVKLTEGSIASGLEERIAAYEIELAHLMNDLLDAKQIIKRFESIEDKILYKKHVEGKTLLVVAEELHLSSSYAYNKHAKIMRQLKSI